MTRRRWPPSYGWEPAEVPATAITPSHTPRRDDSAPRPRGAFVPGAAAAPAAAPAYSGTAIGLATMHKSNTVPVFDVEAAREIARMRR